MSFVIVIINRFREKCRRENESVLRAIKDKLVGICLSFCRQRAQFGHFGNCNNAHGGNHKTRVDEPQTDRQVDGTLSL